MTDMAAGGLLRGVTRCQYECMVAGETPEDWRGLNSPQDDDQHRTWSKVLVL